MNNARKVVCFCLGLMSVSVNSKELPLWELGVGFGALHQSCYTGTNQTCSYAFPILLPVYRGDFLKADDKGFRAQLFKDDRYKLDLSADFNFAVESDNLDLREGMEDIGNLLQIGPSIEVTTYKDKYDKWYINLPVRFVFEIDDSDVDSVGYNFSPGLVYEHKFPETSWRIGTSVYAQYGSQEYNEIYYGVDEQFATSTRSAYEADGGYSGARLQLALTSKTPKNLLVFFLRYDNISGAVFDDSPLVETDDNLTVGFLYSRYVLKSKTMVDRR